MIGPSRREGSENPHSFWACPGCPQGRGRACPQPLLVVGSSALHPAAPFSPFLSAGPAAPTVLSGLSGWGSEKRSELEATQPAGAE